MGLRKNELARVTPVNGPTTRGWRALNEAEYDAWYASDDAKGMTCDGETKLAPRRKRFTLNRDDVVTVLKGRTAWTGDFGGPVRNCALVMTKDGEILYMKRASLTAA